MVRSPGSGEARRRRLCLQRIELLGVAVEKLLFDRGVERLVPRGACRGSGDHGQMNRPAILDARRRHTPGNATRGQSLPISSANSLFTAEQTAAA